MDVRLVSAYLSREHDSDGVLSRLARGVDRQQGWVCLVRYAADVNNPTSVRHLAYIDGRLRRQNRGVYVDRERFLDFRECVVP